MQSAPGLTHTFRIFIKCIILAHNHQGGVAEPSEHDESLTAEIQKALALVEISLQDHIILANNEYYSFKRNNLI